MVKEITTGPIKTTITANSSTENVMDKESFATRMEECIRANFKMTRKVARARSITRTIYTTRVILRTISGMELVNFYVTGRSFFKDTGSTTQQSIHVREKFRPSYKKDKVYWILPNHTSSIDTRVISAK